MPGKNRYSRSPWPGGAFSQAAFTVGAEAANAITVTVQLKDQAQTPSQRLACHAYLSTDPAGGNLATAPTGGVAVGASGVVIETVSEQCFLLVTTATGEVRVVITDSGTPTLYLVIVLPDGTLAVSPAITFA